MSEKFHLSDKFLKNYEKREPAWGYGELSKFVYNRTYARNKDDGSKETFFDTIQRVVEGTFTLQRDHCGRMGLPWDAFRAQMSAQKMFQKIWEFKFSPPGRGLWCMGTPILDKIGSAALNNCGMVSTADIKKDFAEPFAWACDMLMLGVGIGFDTKGAGTVIIKQPRDQCVKFQIPDTREGWVDAVRLLLEAYTGKNCVTFDYDLIRPAGTPIKGFGGTASGPDPLKEGLDNIDKLLASKIGEPISAVVITDIMNYIGKFVVAGNVRRSAEIAIGEIDDADFIGMKDPIEHEAELRDRRWASNNSVFARADSDFSTITSNIAKNGEPGIVFLENSRHYGRIKDGWHDENSTKYDAVDGYNPCVTADTWVMTTEGAKQVQDLLGTAREQYLINGNRSPGTQFWSAGRKPVFLLESEEGHNLKLTYNHEVKARRPANPEIEWIEAGDLQPGDKIYLSSHRDFDDSDWLFTATGTWEEGYPLGLLVGDGTFNDNKAIISVWDDEGSDNIRNCVLKCIEHLPKRSDFKGFHKVKRETAVIEYRLVLKELTTIALRYNIYQGNKKITPEIERTSNGFYAGFLQGLFDADGSVQGTQEKGVSIRLSQSDKELLQACQRMLLRLGITSTIYDRKPEHYSVLPDGRGGHKEYLCKAQWELIIAGEDLEVYKEKIGFSHLKKHERLVELLSSYKRKLNQSKFTCTFKSLTPAGIEEVYDCTVDAIHCFDANGIIVHNCGEQSLRSYELCCLVETYPANHDTAEEFLETLKYAYLYAKSVTLLPTHNERTNQVMLQNRRIGLSQSGIRQALKKFGHASYFKEFCDEAYTRVKKWDLIYSRWLGIPHSIKRTTVKPSGTVSILAGAFPGVHCAHSSHYLRTVRISANSEYVQPLLKAGYRIEFDNNDSDKMLKAMKATLPNGQADADFLSDEPLLLSQYPEQTLSEYATLGGLLVVYFPVEESHFTKSKYEISLWEQLAVVRELQEKWSDNSVSCTVTIKPNEVADLHSAIEFHASYVKTLSFLPLEDHQYAQAPYQSISAAEYKEYADSLKKIRYHKKSKEEITGSKFCDSDVCTI